MFCSSGHKQTPLLSEELSSASSAGVAANGMKNVSIQLYTSCSTFCLKFRGSILQRLQLIPIAVLLNVRIQLTIVDL